MKRILFIAILANTLIVVTLGSCQKENLPSTSTNVGAPPSNTSLEFDVVANHWINYANEVYIDDFPGILALANAAGSRSVNVYLMSNGKKLLLNNFGITFMDNQLWATITQTDLKINYRCSEGKLPFTSLDIRIEAK